MLGVDDWARKRGQTYGTILVDLERHHVVDLLEDCTAASLADWLRAHPGVEVITRDRAGAYAETTSSTLALAAGSGETAPGRADVPEDSPGP